MEKTNEVLELLRDKLDARGIDLIIDGPSLIYYHRKTGIKIVDFQAGLGPIGTTMGMMSTFAQVKQALATLVTVPLSDNQFAALLSFVGHISVEKFQNSTVLSELNKGNYGSVPKLMQRWRTGIVGNTGRSKVRPDYVARRKYEGELFSTPDWLSYRDYMPGYAAFDYKPTEYTADLYSAEQPGSNISFQQLYERLRAAKRLAYIDLVDSGAITREEFINLGFTFG